MASERPGEELEQIAARVVESLEELIAVMKEAAKQISCGRPVEEVQVHDWQLYLARRNPEDGESCIEAIVCTMDLEDYMSLIETAAAEEGLCLDDAAKLEVTLPDAEFGEDMVTGGFGDFKGVSVELHNRCLEELMESVCNLLVERGLAVACVPDEDVIFYLPLPRQV